MKVLKDFYIHKNVTVDEFRVVKLRTGTRGNKREQEKLTEEKQEDHARDERLSRLVFYVDGVDCVHCFLVYVVYFSS